MSNFCLNSCQFVVKFGNDYSQWMINQDDIVNWDCIEQIVSLEVIYTIYIIIKFYNLESRVLEPLCL